MKWQKESLERFQTLLKLSNRIIDFCIILVKYIINFFEFSPSRSSSSTVQLLAEEAFPLDAMDPRAAEEALSSAKSALASASGEAEKATAQIQIDTAEAIIRAVNTGV